MNVTVAPDALTAHTLNEVAEMTTQLRIETDKLQRYADELVTRLAAGQRLDDQFAAGALRRITELNLRRQTMIDLLARVEGSKALIELAVTTGDGRQWFAAPGEL